MWVGQEQKRVDSCDVVIVGAGLVGAAVAARLARTGLETAVLEAGDVAGGATGHSAGMVLTGLAGHYNWAVSAYGRQRAQEIWALTVEGRVRLVETAKRLGVAVERGGSLSLAVEEAEVEALENSATLLQEDGFAAQFTRADPLGRGFGAALHWPDDVTVDGTELTRALLAESGVTVHTGTEVYNLEPEGDGVRVWAHGRNVLCGGVVLAVNGYAPLLDSYFASKIAPTRGLVMLTEPLDAMILDRPCCADYGYEYCRQLPDRRLLLGGWRRPGSATSGPKLEDTVRDGLISFASRHFTEIETSKSTLRSGTMGFTPDGLPLVGSLPDLPQVYFAVGLGGRGLAWALVVAERLTELMLRDTAPGVLSAARLG